MKKIITFIFSLTLVTASAFASCDEQYQLKANKMLPQSTLGNIGMSTGTFLIVGSAMAGTIAMGTGPIGLLTITPLVAYERKVMRLEYFAELIQSVKANSATNFEHWSAPNTQSFWGNVQTAGCERHGGCGTGQTIYDRIRNQISRKFGEVTEAQIAKAIYNADQNNAFCTNEHNQLELKTSIQEFSKVIMNYL